MKVDRIVWEQAGIFRLESDQKCGLIKADKKYAYKLTNPEGTINFLPEENLLISSLGGKITVESVLPPVYSTMKKAEDNLFMVFRDNKASLYSLKSGNFYKFPDGISEVKEMQNDMIPCMVGKKWGLYYLTGDMRIPPEFDDISWIDSYWVVTNKGISAILSSDLKSIHNSNYCMVNYLGHGLFSAKKGSNRFILAGSGEVFSGRKVYFEPIDGFGFRIRINGKIGLLSNDNKIVVPPFFDSIREIWPGNMFIVKQNAQYGLFSQEKGMVLPANYSRIRVADPERFLVVQKKMKWGIFDLCGNANLEPQLSQIGPSLKIALLFSNKTLGDTYIFQDHYLISEKIKSQEKSGNDLFIIRTDKQWMLINKSGVNLIGDGCEEIIHLHQNLLGFSKCGKYGIISTNGDLVCLCEFDEIKTFERTLLKVRKGEVYGLIDLNAKEILPVKYEEIRSFNMNYWKVRMSGKYGLISITGKEILPTKYDDIESIKDFWGVKNNGKWGITDFYGNEFIPNKYDEIQLFDNKCLKVRIGREWGLFGLKGEEILPVQYDEILPFEEQYLKVQIDRKWGISDLSGHEILPAKYDSILERKSDGFNVYYVQKHGFVSLKNMKFIPDKEETNRFFNGDTARRSEKDPLPKNNRGGFTTYDFRSI